MEMLQSMFALSGLAFLTFGILVLKKQLKSYLRGVSF